MRYKFVDAVTNFTLRSVGADRRKIDVIFSAHGERVSSGFGPGVLVEVLVGSEELNIDAVCEVQKVRL